ncbi:glycosyltransferase family 4 protein [Halomonas heilongjiangensis]|uniref:Glycosyltransferase family 1 protein n=1 Tax=Halomonas heilongjiangensis TaxID=1387883 RepID=A0A2N7TUJ5_9GAMM|nr:glycosyltransferase family 4 protein [Halomonas heilongjiangensis]PMR71862.1 glycosyltransferase family 1 protein [Halomonas heilongjiangensis]PXX87675.1 glycosyltransferase family 1 protein [Halomonas heilongjiangensis]
MSYRDDPSDEIDVLFIAANTRSLAVNRGSLVRALQDRGLSVGALVPDDDFLQDVHELGITTWRYHLERHSMGLRGELSRFLHLRKLIREIAPRAVFAYAVKPIILGIPAARLAGVRETYCLATGLGYLYGTHDRRTRIIRALVTYCYALAGGLSKAFFFQNPDDRAELQQNLLFRHLARSVVVNGSGVDLDDYPYAEAPTEPITFLFMGRFLKEKGIDDFVEAARRLSRRYPAAEFVALGDADGALVNSISTAQIEAWHEEGIVRLPGKVRDVHRYLKSASVMVLPSYYREGIPRSLLEALSTGRPVITCDSPGCRETVQEGVNGWLVPPRDAESIAARMETFLNDPGLVREMGHNGRKMAEQKFSIHLVNQQMLCEMSIAHALEPLQSST